MTLMLHLLGQLMVELQQHPVDLVEDVRLRREGNTDIAVGECGRDVGNTNHARAHDSYTNI